MACLKALGDLLIDWALVPAVVTARLGDGHTWENVSELACSWVMRLLCGGPTD